MLERYKSSTFYANQSLDSYRVDLNESTILMSDFISIFVGPPIPGMKKVVSYRGELNKQSTVDTELKRVIVLG